MQSPAKAAAPPRRMPLQPKNFDFIPSVWIHPKPKPIAFRYPPSTGEGAGKESRPISSPELGTMAGLRDASLSEELAAARLRRERLRAERERTEEAMRERYAAMRRWAVELEKWAEEQRNLELELRLLIELRDLQSSSTISSPVQSLREKEQQRSMEVKLQMSPVQPLREKEKQKIVEVQLQGPKIAEQYSEVGMPSSIEENETEK
ncbi:high mobility group B protein 6-like [Musa acuminata AAA Group]|uniref:high mobility group B protein 6-like n=1 Tax=Musa acuminata AAA Group TaxID=214697 RepID=UPI0031E3411A